MNVNFRSTCSLVLMFVFAILKTDVVSAAVTTSQVVASESQQEIIKQNKQAIEDAIYQPTPQIISSKEVEAGSGANGAGNTSTTQFLVERIDVQGVTILSPEEIGKIVSGHEKTQMTLANVQEMVNRITDIYRKKGFITSRAYLPPQTMKDGILVIQVVEGKIGKVEFKGNRYFSSSLLARKLNISETGYFDYSALQRSLVYINQHPDRLARTILVPGAQPGTTDVVVNVKDRLPIHAGFSYDNYGSRYIDHNRFALILEHNNFLGFDDRMLAKIQTSASDYMRFAQLQYVLPVTETLNVGAYIMYSHLALTKEFKDLDAQGKALAVGLFADKALVRDVGFEWRINGGFDYKNISNEELGTEISRDKIRIVKVGTSFDITDRWGRTIINPEFDQGFPEILNGMASKDPGSSRTGAGGSFQKEVINFYRLQPLAFATSLLWKNSGQWSHYNLPSSEQFEIGGPNSVRGYAPAEFSGDKGFYSALEWSIPPYFISDSMRVPFTQEKLKDSFRFVAFYDAGFVHLNNPGVGEAKNEFLRGWGYGFRLNVRDNLSCRLELGYPLGKKPADGNSMHPWVEVTARF